MSEEALQKFPRQLHERDLFNSDEYRELCNRSGTDDEPFLGCCFVQRRPRTS